MSELLSQAQEQFLIFRLLYGKILLTILVTFCLAWQTAMAQTKWTNLDGNEKFFTACCIIALIGDKLIAFFDKTAASIAKGQLPIGDGGGTKFLTRTTDTVVQTQTIEAKASGGKDPITPDAGKG